MQVTKKGVDCKVSLKGIPFKLTPFLWKVMDNQISMLINNSNPDIGIGLVNHLRNSGRKDPSEFILNYNYYAIGLTKSHVASVIRRGALGSFNIRFNKLCLSALASASPKEIIRQSFCAPIGFGGTTYPCKSFFCANCYMRKANDTKEAIASKLKLNKILPNAVKTLVISSETMIQSNSYGYDFELDDDLSERICNRLKSIKFIAVRTIGATIKENRNPAICTRTAILLDAVNMDFAKKTLIKLKTSIFKKNPNRVINITVEEGLDNVCLKLYDCPPVCLAGIAPEGLHSSVLQHSLESYKAAVKGKKKAIIFGTGVQ
jgi:hypothetical protein